MKPIVSIVIPVFNGEAFIKNCITSITNQTIRELQIIVVDDGSRDDTLQILRTLEFEDERIEVIHQDNAGVSVARNAGMQAVQSEWVLFVDADDIIAPDYCASMLEAVERLNVDVVIARPSSEDQRYCYLLQEKDKLIQACLSYNESSYTFNIDAPWGKMFRFRVISEHHICFPEELIRSEDAFFCLQFYEAADRIGILNQYGYVHVEREGSICRSFSPNAPEILENVLLVNHQWVMKHYPDRVDYLNALWYRVLPGIVECERIFFLHPDFSGILISEYQKFLGQTMVHQAIHSLKLSSISTKQYKLRLLLYKLHLGGIFIMIKGKKVIWRKHERYK